MTASRNAFVERLIARHGSAVHAFLSRRVRRSADAADLAQEVYLRMLRVPDPQSIRDPEAYLFTVARNIAKEQAHRDRRAAAAVDVNDVAVERELADTVRVDRSIDAEQRIRRLREVVRQLPPKCYAAVVLQYRLEMSHDDIARALGVSTNMVKKYVGKALGHCRRRMARLK